MNGTAFAGIRVCVRRAYEIYTRVREDNKMEIINNDEIKGKYEQAKGTVKDKFGEATGNEELEAEGEVQHAEGEVQETWGETKRKVSDVIEDVADAVNS